MLFQPSGPAERRSSFKNRQVGSTTTRKGQRFSAIFGSSAAITHHGRSLNFSEKAFFACTGPENHGRGIEKREGSVLIQFLLFLERLVGDTFRDLSVLKIILLSFCVFFLRNLNKHEFLHFEGSASRIGIRFEALDEFLAVFGYTRQGEDGRYDLTLLGITSIFPLVSVHHIPVQDVRDEHGNRRYGGSWQLQPELLLGLLDRALDRVRHPGCGHMACRTRISGSTTPPADALMTPGPLRTLRLRLTRAR